MSDREKNYHLLWQKKTNSFKTRITEVSYCFLQEQPVDLTQGLG